MADETHPMGARGQIGSRLGAARWSRRRLVAAAGATDSLLGLGIHARGSGGRTARGAARQEATAIQATEPSASPTAATPDATPAGSPVARGLEIVRAPFPVDPGPPVPGGTLRLTIGSTVGNFNPVAAAQDTQIAASYLDPLLRVDPVTMEPIPWLATEWTWNSDNTSITYTLRDNVVWHDGSPLTPEDVRFSFLVYRDDTSSAFGRFFDLLREIEVVGDLRVRVRLAEPDGGWLPNASTLPIFQGAQYSEFWTDQPAGSRSLDGFDWQASAPVGSGPWAIEGWRERRIEFGRNEEYWAGPPHVERLELATFGGVDARLERWRGGAADIVWPVPPQAAESLEQEPGRLYVCDAAAVMFAAFNFANPVRDVPGFPSFFTDIRLRTALSVAIDRDRYAEEIFGGFLRQDLAGTIAQPWANDPSLTNPPRNRITAQALLTSAGWTVRGGDGIRTDINGTPLSLVAIVPADGSSQLEATLRSVADDLEVIGVELDVQALDPVVFAQRWQVTHDFDLIAYSYRLYPGFSDFDLYGSLWDIRANSQGWNPGGYRNDEVDDVISNLLTTTDMENQRELLGRLQELVNDDLFGLWFGFPQDLVLVGPTVRGFQPNVHWQTWDTRTLWLAQH